MSSNVINPVGSSIGLSNNIELISVMREVSTDILNSTPRNPGYINASNAIAFKQFDAPMGVYNHFAIQGGGLFEETAEFENFKTDALKTLPVVQFSQEKRTKRIPISFEAVKYAEAGDYSMLSLTAADMGRKGRKTLDKMGSEVYKNAFVTLGVDGVPMLAATAITGSTHPGFGDNLVAAAVAGLANLAQTDIEGALTLMTTMPDRSGTVAGHEPVAILVAPEALATFSRLIDSKTFTDQANPNVINYISNTYGIQLISMPELSPRYGAYANIPAGYTGVAFVLSQDHSIFNATSTGLSTWIQDYTSTSNAETNYMGLIHNIFGFYDGSGVVGLLY